MSVSTMDLSPSPPYLPTYNAREWGRELPREEGLDMSREQHKHSSNCNPCCCKVTSPIFNLTYLG